MTKPFRGYIILTQFKVLYVKPMSKRSSITGSFQRAADGASAVSECFVNGLTRVVLNVPTATEVVINSAHMSVCVKSGREPI